MYIVNPKETAFDIFQQRTPFTTTHLRSSSRPQNQKHGVRPLLPRTRRTRRLPEPHFAFDAQSQQIDSQAYFHGEIWLYPQKANDTRGPNASNTSCDDAIDAHRTPLRSPPPHNVLRSECANSLFFTEGPIFLKRMCDLAKQIKSSALDDGCGVLSRYWASTARVHGALNPERETISHPTRQSCLNSS